MISFIHGILRNKQAKGKKEREKGSQRQIKKQTLNYREQTDVYQRGGGWGGDGSNR